MVGSGWAYLALMFVLGLIFCCVNLPESTHSEVISRSEQNSFRRHRSLTWIREPSQHATNENSPWRVANKTMEILQHPRVMELCNRPSERELSGDEGANIPGFKLNKVLIVISPGQTTSKNVVGDISSPRVNCNFKIYAKSSSVEKIATFPEVVNIYKNVQNNKGSFKIYSMLPTGSTCSEGQLSPLGAAQHILLGQQLSKAYNKKLKILREIPGESFLAGRSIRTETGYQTAVAFLHGFFKEKQFSKMVLEKSSDNFCKNVPSETCSCAKADFLKQQMSKSIERGYLLFKDQPTRDNDLNAKLDIENGNISPKEIISLVSGWLCDQDNMPCHASRCLNLNTSNLNNLFQAADSHVGVVTNNNIFSSFAQLHTHPFLSNALHWLQNSDDDFILYSAEESFLSFLVSSLEIPQTRLLPSGSRLVFEAYNAVSPRQSNKTYLRVLLNGKDITRDVKLCSESVQPLCEMERAYSVLQDRRFNGQSYHEECLSN